MFDIGFSELLLIGIVALVIVGPEDLPRVARTLGHLLGKLRRYVADVKSDISREMEASELKTLVGDVQDSARSLQASFNEQAREMEADFKRTVAETEADLQRSIQAVPSPELSPVTEEPTEAVVEDTATLDDLHNESQPDLFASTEPKNKKS